MCGLLHLCLPLELRFLGTCLEDLACKDYAFLKEAEQRANNLAEVSKCTDLKDSVTRSKLITSLALLHLINSSCSHAIYEALAEEMKTGKPVNYDEKTLEELLLLFTMAMHHPSFSFHERSELVKYCERLESALEPQNGPSGTLESYMLPCLPYSPYPLPLPPYEASSEGAPCLPAQAHVNLTTTSAQRPGISSIEVRPESRRKKAVRLKIQWTDRRQSEVTRTFVDVATLHQKLSQLSAADPSGRGKNIPQLPACIERNEELEGMHLELAEFFSSVVSLPAGYLWSDAVVAFFQPCSRRPGDEKPPLVPQPSPSSPDVSVPPPPEDPRLGFLALYGNAQVPAVAPPVPGLLPPCISNGPILPAMDGSVTQQALERRSPVVSPLSSAPGSPFESPVTSGSNSRAASPWTAPPRPPRAWEPQQQGNVPASVEDLLRQAHLKKHVSAFKNCTLDEVLSMSEDRLKQKGLPSHSSRRLLKEIAVLKNQCHTNGLVGSHRNNASGIYVQGTMDSSTSCSSECSSPSPPPALRAVRIQSPASSSSEDGTQRQRNAKAWASSPDNADVATSASARTPAVNRDASDQPPRLPLPSVLPFRYGPPGSPTVILDPQQHRYLVIADRSPSYAQRNPGSVVRGVGPTPVLPSKVATAGELTPVTTTVSATTSFPPPLCGYVPAGLFPHHHHSFGPFVASGTGSPMAQPPSNGFLTGYPFPASPGFTPAAYVPLSSFVAPPPTAQAAVATSPLPIAGGMPGNVGPVVPSCYNCGTTGHKGSDCKESSIGDRMKLSQYRINYSAGSATPLEQQP